MHCTAFQRISLYNLSCTQQSNHHELAWLCLRTNMIRASTRFEYFHAVRLCRGYNPFIGGGYLKDLETTYVKYGPLKLASFGIVSPPRFSLWQPLRPQTRPFELKLQRATSGICSSSITYHTKCPYAHIMIIRIKLYVINTFKQTCSYLYIYIYSKPRQV